MNPFGLGLAGLLEKLPEGMGQMGLLPMLMQGLGGGGGNKPPTQAGLDAKPSGGEVRALNLPQAEAPPSGDDEYRSDVFDKLAERFMGKREGFDAENWQRGGDRRNDLAAMLLGLGSGMPHF